MKILVIGATSAIATACSRRFAAQGHALYLLARDTERLDSLAQDLRVRGAASVSCKAFDARDIEGMDALITDVIADAGRLDRVLIAHGTLCEQKDCEHSVSQSIDALKVNLLSIVALLTPLANHFEAQRHGAIAVISSVAGDRGRQSNYLYGTAKGGVSVFLQGLRNRLARSGVQVLTVKPGFVDTPMTAGFTKGPLWASPAKVAADIDRALHRQRNVIYTPGFWALIMLVIKSIPEAFFKRLSL
ncbi:SDR family oxidoreductase [Ectopseudomonas khazarica]|uniref:SDR family oxidoreductase n=1 Tax=Ectopseudomonas khazarica TaxID=2502979 RepID=UPI0015CEB8AD